ncbi:putative L-aspartate oxidase [Bacteriovorax sp. BSW11_IV]|uniref:L-aspartate oxidase n=1 Tax=Bacteriovorax sp. BSW11_IV TaxID=1353529 RepID=UPI000389F141|nr:FAD-dependent oxidoreductase [Bacteriovorax sp. BSW11_IV]EQC48283.1 putative L-aspartate oxidase [Bacteriovorax sp. BSW11_IV]
MNEYNFDVLIIGTGVAGLSSAAKLAESNLKIGIITREADPNVTNTYWAQGGIIYSSAGDESLIEDIIKASSNSCNIEAAKILTKRSGRILEEMLLEKAQTNFERDEGKLKFTREAAHSKERILYQGDFTGKAIQVSLLNYLKDKTRFPNVSILTRHTAIDLLTPIHHGVKIQQRYEENKVVGAYVYNQEMKQVVKVLAKNTILATGGIGAIYLHHSNSEGARGDGHAMAKRAGAQLIDMEFIQFHPTTFYNSSSHRRFLVSEAIRGEGGVLLNCNGERFMEKYHPDMELAPRDVVARAILEETIETRHECVYLDISHKDPDWIKNRFPTIYAHCLENGFDITLKPIPVVPAAHYTCGGVKTNLKGQTTIPNLFAVGEVACTGLHGANRLASTSLLEGLTFGYIAAEEILENITAEESYPSYMIKDWQDGTKHTDRALIHQDWLTLKHTMWNYVGLTRTSDRLGRANAMFHELLDEIGKFYKKCVLTDELIGIRNAVEVGHMVLQASRRNRESLGCFFRKS